MSSIISCCRLKDYSVYHVGGMSMERSCLIMHREATLMEAVHIDHSNEQIQMNQEAFKSHLIFPEDTIFQMERVH